MKIGIDVLGGDFAPDANIAGAILARKELSKDVKIVLIGDQNVILSGLSSYNEDASGYEIVHAPDIITMHDPLKSSSFLWFLASKKYFP